MESADLRVLPVAVTVDHSLTRESMKDSQCHVNDFLLSSPYRLVSSHLRRYREGRAGIGLRKVRRCAVMGGGGLSESRVRGTRVRTYNCRVGIVCHGSRWDSCGGSGPSESGLVRFLVLDPPQTSRSPPLSPALPLTVPLFSRIDPFHPFSCCLPVTRPPCPL